MPKYKIFFAVFFLSFLSAAVSGRETPVIFSTTDYRPWLNMKSRQWRPPDYSQQTSALGYNKDTFNPKNALIKESVDFWVKIYSKYNVNQGVLHDSIHESLVYQVLDFSDIMNNPKTSRKKKENLRLKRVKKAKKEIKARLLRLSKIKNSRQAIKNLKGKDKQLWKLFKPIKERNKFRVARHKNRIRFQLGQSNLILKGLFSSGAYLEEMEDIFRKHNLPIELTRLVFVESSFNLKARSSSHATGIWQFIKPTAQRYLKMNPSVDERLAPLEATEASAKLLKRNYNQLKSWPLAVTAYNRGLAGVKRLLKKKRAKKLEDLLDTRRGHFRFASANFYTSFLAILQVEKEAKKHFGKVRWRLPLRSEKVRLSKTILVQTLISWFDGNEKKAKEFNPHIKKAVWDGLIRIGKGNFIRIEKKKVDQVQSELKSIKNVNLYKGRLYRIKKNDTLSSIAKRFRTSIESLKKENPSLKPRFLQRGRLIVIPKK